MSFLLIVLSLLPSDTKCSHCDWPIRFVGQNYEFNLTCSFRGSDLKPNNEYRIGISDSSYVLLELLSYCGESNLRYVHKSGVVLEEGEYVASFGVLSEYQKTLAELSVETEEYQIIIFKYLQPLKNGVWHYRNVEDKLVKKEIYDWGILAESHTYN